jgi:hypothetical protein
MSPACPICGEAGLRTRFELPDLAVDRCFACRHRVARHSTTSATCSDYHEQYAQGDFVESLRATRERQAAALIEMIRRNVPQAGRLLDYGAGRGWFLEACRRDGIGPIAGADSSDIAVRGLRDSGIEAHKLSDDGVRPGSLNRALSFRPRIVNFLDVLEHVPPNEVSAQFKEILDACGDDVELAVVKVPVPGILYAAARSLSRLGRHGSIRQLYQTGTWPPHFSYFSPRSVEILFHGLGFVVVERCGDVDFEPAQLAGRLGIRGGTARCLANLGGRAFGLAIRSTRLFDSTIVAARPVPQRSIACEKRSEA